MSREAIIFVLGAVIILVPFLGLPDSLKEQVLIGLGVIIMICGYGLRRRSFLREIETAPGERSADSFSEYKPSSDK